MMQYLLAAILLLGVPFLLYCLRNFARELKPRRYKVVVSAISSVASPRLVSSSSFRTEPRMIPLLERTRSVS